MRAGRGRREGGRKGERERESYFELTVTMSASIYSFQEVHTLTLREMHVLGRFKLTSQLL